MPPSLRSPGAIESAFHQPGGVIQIPSGGASGRRLPGQEGLPTAFSQPSSTPQGSIWPETRRSIGLPRARSPPPGEGDQRWRSLTLRVE